MQHYGEWDEWLAANFARSILVISATASWEDMRQLQVEPKPNPSWKCPVTGLEGTGTNQNTGITNYFHWRISTALEQISLKDGGVFIPRRYSKLS